MSVSETVEQSWYEDVYAYARDELATGGLSSEIVAETFLECVEEFEAFTPAQIWMFGVYEAFIDISDSDSPTQQWRSTSGKAFEAVVQEYMNEFLPEGIRVYNPRRDEICMMLAKLEPFGDEKTNKIDLGLVGEYNDDWYLFGGVHAKTSIRGRLESDVPGATALRERGLVSPLVTLGVGERNGQVQNDLGEIGVTNPFTNIYSLSTNPEIDNETLYLGSTTTPTEPVQHHVKYLPNKSQASILTQDVMEWWELTRPYVTSHDELRVNGL